MLRIRGVSLGCSRFTTDILNEKEKAEENIYIARMEKEQRESLKSQGKKQPLESDEGQDNTRNGAAESQKATKVQKTKKSN